MFDEMLFYGVPYLGNSHKYSLAATGIRFRSREFRSREAANVEMYEYCTKHGLHIERVYDDKHYKTYICNNGVRFYVNRV